MDLFSEFDKYPEVKGRDSVAGNDQRTELIDHIRIDNKTYLRFEVQERIESGEDLLGINHRELDTISSDRLSEYLIELRKKWEATQKKNDGQRPSAPAAIPKEIESTPVPKNQIPFGDAIQRIKIALKADWYYPRGAFKLNGVEITDFLPTM